MPKRLHIYTTEDVLKSVKQGVEVTANCGLRKTLTAADIDEAATSTRKPCRKCTDVVAEMAKGQDVTLVRREGWEALKKRETTYTVKLKATAHGYTFEWPLAG
jgi:hypothetical protein